MPRISEFYGIVIEMYYADHPPPHFHARYGEESAKIALADGEYSPGPCPVVHFGSCENGRRHTEAN
jgi:hypothetical protein